MTVRTSILLATAALVAMPCALAQDKGAAGAKKLFCWQEKGQRVCSDALPAEAVNAARDEISASSGLRPGWNGSNWSGQTLICSSTARS